MKILTISREESRPETAITEFLADSGLTKIATTPLLLTSAQLDDCDCIIYIERPPQLQVIDKLKGSGRPSILVADLDVQGSQCLLIPFEVLDRPDSVSIGIDVIQHHLDTLPINASMSDSDSSTSSENFSRANNPNNTQRAPTIHQIRQANDDFDSFESLATG
jgi:hypothetical protein